MCRVGHIWEIVAIKVEDAWKASLLEMWTLTWPAEYISLLCSPPEAQVCVPLPPVSSRGLEELHLGKWMLLISTLAIRTTSKHSKAQTRLHDVSDRSKITSSARLTMTIFHLHADFLCHSVDWCYF